MLQSSIVPGASPASRPSRRGYISTLGPTLRVLLWCVFSSFALLGATGAYLFVVTVMNTAYDAPLFTTPFTFWTLLGHTGFGAFATVPFVIFGVWHMVTSWNRTNRRAIVRGYVVFALGLIVIISGFALVQLEGLPQLSTGTLSRRIVYFLHLLIPAAAVIAYIWHRKRGPKIRYAYGRAWAVGVGLIVAVLAGSHFLDPRSVSREGPKDGTQYFEPSLARTATGKFIPATAMMTDEYCMKCHPGVYDDHLHSAHKFSSFNNPAYLASVKETRKVSMERDGKMNASRWCAGCHDPTPFFSGKFDDPDYDIINDPTAHAGVTCVACHSITHINGTEGNANYTIEEAQHYPFAGSSDPLLDWINTQLIKAKPELHKKTFLKPLHKSAEFCSTCHKVSLPAELTHYKDFLRGQNHYDSFVNSGVGNGSRSFYFPPVGKSDNCASCHMPLKPDTSFGSKDFDGSGITKRHDHFFPAANTGLFELLKSEERYKSQGVAFQKSIDKNAEYLRDKKLRIDLFGLKDLDSAGGVQDASLKQLRPALPEVKPGGSYLVEVVVRTLGLGHHFTQGTVDSNEVWVEFEAKSAGKVVARSGGLSGPGDSGTVDEWAHFINVLMLDRDGNRIDRRNPQDIFTPLYDHQIPPGAGQVVHYKLDLPKQLTGPLQLTARLRYRKFDYNYTKFVHQDSGKSMPVPVLPVVDLCADSVMLAVQGGPAVPAQTSPIQPAWQRWNDYGIGCLIEGGPGMKRGNLRQAEAAFGQLISSGDKVAVGQGHLNQARVYLEQGRLGEAAAALNQARASETPPPWWSLAWFSGLVTAQDATTPASLDAAIAEFAKIVDPANRPRRPDGSVKFDFTRDPVVLNELGRTLFRRSQLEADGSDSQTKIVRRAVAAYNRALAVDSEDLDSHYGLSQCYATLAAGAKSLSLPSASIEVLASRAAGGDLDAMRQIPSAVVELSRRDSDPNVPRVGPFRAAISALANLPESPDHAAALAELHLAMHGLLKPDEVARAAAAQKYRVAHPAANAAAEAVVFYPTDRLP